MHLSEQSHSPAQAVVGMAGRERQQWRRERLMAILNVGLPALSRHVFELNTLLGSPSVDLKRIAKVIRTDPGMSAQVIRMCNSALFGLRRRVLSIEEAAILMGSERLRTLVLTCQVMEFTGQQLSEEGVQAFWQHSFMTGMLSERVAKWIEYSEPEQAYLGGLLHDVGMLPLMMVAAEEDPPNADIAVKFGSGSLDSEKNNFGLNHCEVGRTIGTSWNFFPSFIDIFENHHHPERSTRDPHLVGIVAAADHFSELRILTSNADGGTLEITDAAPDDEFLTLCFPRLDPEERSELTEMLENEYLHLLPVIEFNNPAGRRTAGKNVRE
jgi:putative nucleotidyltransferase with HDIG domain